MSDRVGDWMQTFTGKQFWPMDPKPDEVCIEDIAHALSNQCRYGGHALRFYSVAEHCVVLSRAVAPEHALAALLHDASEAYLVDVPRPLKRFLKGYGAAEARVQAAVLIRFDQAMECPQAVHDADARILVDEMRQVMGAPPAPWLLDGRPMPEPLGVTLPCWLPEVAESRFLERFHALTSQRYDMENVAVREMPLVEGHNDPYRHLVIAEHSPLDKVWSAILPKSERSGTVCAHCGSFEMLRTGACETCQACGTTTGCA